MGIAKLPSDGTEHSSASRWLIPLASRPSASVRAYLFPPPGTGASFYLPLAEELPTFMEPVALQAPGREERSAEPRVRHYSKLVDATTEAMSAAGSSKPSVFLGYCASGIWAFETGRALVNMGAQGPLLLGVCAAPAPGEAAKYTRYMARPDRAVRALLQEQALTPDMRELATQAIYRDLITALSYRYSPGAQVTCPVSLFSGEEDAIIPRNLVRRWDAYTSSRVIADRAYAGGHVFLREHWGTVAQHFSSDVKAVLASQPEEPSSPLT
ncbi:thioesterase domain-containing protein [Streptomyces sp. Qhu-G9]|uniref:thioesterase II family protein n=1 Tax=Streptomyces sp. Qhu-G9 TaxID=3452799 RepID=UPI0022AC674B|nr:thioesterase domain-containing protein [Streptomyces aurantiacus]WAU82666.1 thioesterase domain-containing protein [Streptomyces aurantiacus]